LRQSLRSAKAENTYPHGKPYRQERRTENSLAKVQNSESKSQGSFRAIAAFTRRCFENPACSGKKQSPVCSEAAPIGEKEEEKSVKKAKVSKEPVRGFCRLED
jgi:hypothetical protein